MGQVRTIALCLSLSLSAPLAYAQGSAPSKAQIDEARQRRDRGLKLYEDGAWDAALSEFQRAYDLAPTYKLLYNLALAHRQLNDYAAAVGDANQGDREIERQCAGAGSRRYRPRRRD